MTRRRALIVVDVQNDFCEGGSLAVAGGASVARRTTEFLTQVDPGFFQVVVASRDAHVEPGEHFAADPDYVDTWPAHCVRGTDGYEYHRDLVLPEDVIEVFKGAYDAAYSAFEGADAEDVALADLLFGMGIDEVYVAGIALGHCVRMTALSSLDHGFATTLLADLTVAVDPGTTTEVIDELAAAGARIVTAHQLVRA